MLRCNYFLLCHIYLCNYLYIENVYSKMRYIIYVFDYLLDKVSMKPYYQNKKFVNKTRFNFEQRHHHVSEAFVCSNEASLTSNLQFFIQLKPFNLQCVGNTLGHTQTNIHTHTHTHLHTHLCHPPCGVSIFRAQLRLISSSHL